MASSLPWIDTHDPGARARLRAAARLVHPVTPASPDAFDERALADAVRVLVRQKVSLLGVGFHTESGELPPALAAAVESDRATFARIRDEFESVRRLLHADGIATMLFKSTGMRPGFHYQSSNLDVVVPDGSAARARQRLVELGYVELLNVEEPKKFLFRRFPGDGSSHTLHLHEQVGWGVPFVDSAPLWRNAEPAPDDPDILIPGPVESLLVTLGHWFYEDKELSLGNLLLTANALHRMETPPGHAALDAARRGWEEGFWGALDVFDRSWLDLFGEPFLGADRRGAVDAALRRFSFMNEVLLPRVAYDGMTAARVPFLLNKVVYYRKILRDRRRGAGSKVCDVIATLLWAVRWKLHLRPQKAMLVSISGCDGSGKTMQAERLQHVLDTCDIRNRVMWSRGASSRWMSMAIAAAKVMTGTPRGNGDGGEEEKFRARQSAAGNPAARRAFATLYTIDLFWTYAVRARWHLRAGRVVIFDRFLYDAIVDLSLYTGMDVGEAERRFRWLEKISPRPHVAIVLDVDPAEALRRKPEEGGTGHIAAARDALAAIAATRGLDVIPSGLVIDAVSERVAALALKSFYSRYGTLLNGLLFSNPSQLNPRAGVM